MEPEIQPARRGDEQDRAGASGTHPREGLARVTDARETHVVDWILNGDGDLRVGWSIAIFAILFRLFSLMVGTIAVGLNPTVTKLEFSPSTVLVSEAVVLLAVLGAGSLVALFERRRLLSYNLTGPQSPRRFAEGLVAGFLGLSVLVGEMAAGGWLHFGPVALTGAQIVRYAISWGACFVLVGFFEEGVFRCFLQFTLARSINFWWALAVVSLICADLLLRSRGHEGLVALFWMTRLSAVSGNGVWGVYAAALLGLVPCLLLELKKAESAGFWQAAWVTSTLFGFIHTGNNGENWIGIFAAAAIGFVFCVSIWVTGSAWWAIGCHAGWDWAETFFYGTADSGLQAQGHYLTTAPAGSALWSGGADGPEGSLLVLGVIVLLLLALLALYGRKRARATAAAAIAPQTA